jgi:hypothetical protein
MKKTIFILFFTLVNQFAFSQSEVMQFLSMGFNTSQSAGGYITHYFYGYNDYSEAFVYSYGVALSTENLGTFYPTVDVKYGFSPSKHRLYTGQNNSVGCSWYVPTQGSYELEYKFENGKLVYWASGSGLEWGIPPSYTLERVEQNKQIITIYYSSHSYSEDANIIDSRIFSEKRYNISRTELLELFLRKYVELICEIIDIGNTNRRYGGNFEDNFNEYISALIKGRTLRELAIFRNCIYAIKGYRFTNSTWTEFFNKYLNGYNSRYTNDELMATFTENEKWLLNLIKESENQ